MVDRSEQAATENKAEPQIQHHQITLPKGGGAISGIGEKFQANAVTGTATFSVPIPVTPARGGFEPNLSLVYDSGQGNSVFGLGWDVDIPAISRKTSKGLPRYLDTEDSDVFLLSGAEDLVPVVDETGEKVTDTETGYTIYFYRPRIEGLFARIEKLVPDDPADPVYWRATTKDNITSVYGKTGQARIADPADDKRVFKWLIEESFDAKGNRIAYEYVAEDLTSVPPSVSEQHRHSGTALFSNRHIKKVFYGVKHGTTDQFHFTLVFDYGDHAAGTPTYAPTLDWPVRPDPFSDYRAGFETRTYRLCKRIVLFHDFTELGTGPVSTRELALTHDDNPTLTYLTDVQQSGYKKKVDETFEKNSFPPLTLGYSAATLGNAVEHLDTENLENLPQGLTGPYQFIDLEGEGLSGILVEQGDAWYYKRNLGDGKFSPMTVQTTRPTSAKQAGPPLLTDVDGDGNNELVVRGPYLAGTYTYEDGDWETFRPFAKRLNIDFNDPNLRLIDLTGDGRPDVLITEHYVHTWHECLALEGHDEARRVPVPTDEKEGPRVVFSEPIQTIFLADMSGDGLTDIVRIRNGEVCYWPNRGYGRFGARVVMEGAPLFDAPDLFNPRYVKLGDVDGSGTADIFYVGAGSIRLWLNRTGNSLGPENELPFPAVDSLSSVDVVDLLGKGTSCLVWSTQLPGVASQQLRHVDLMPEGKPHLLKTINNNMGKQVNVTYAPSTRYYLEDRAAGNPWITMLPFPVHVLESVETKDLVCGSSLHTQYRYHHGFYDGFEREFRGFGMVETLDTEAHEKYEGTEEGEHYVAPILTRTWFHNGAFLKQSQISTQYQSEYFAGVDTGNPDILPDTVIDPDVTLTTDERREAHRALKGRTLRQEVYEYDFDIEDVVGGAPYTVAESNFFVRRVQPMGEQRNAVFFVHPRETITWHYEKIADDPRIVHDCTLQVDPYGNLEKSCTVAYPRRGTTGPYPDEQNATHATAQVSSFINKDPNGPDEDDFYLIGVPAEAKSHEIGGIAAPTTGYLEFDGVSGDVDAALANEIRFDESVDETTVAARLLSWQRFLYWDQTQSGPGLIGEVTDKALLHHVETALLTPELVDNSFGTDVTDANLGDAGYFQQTTAIDPVQHWWNPGLVQNYLGAVDFHLPFRTDDPFGNSLTVTWDSYRLAATTTVDELGNTATAEIDYRMMSPWKLTGPNLNSTEAITDPLGMVIATSIYGTEDGADKGDLSLDSYVVQDVPNLRHVIDNPHTYLQDASTFFFYDLDAWTDRQEPVQAIGLVRETHYQDLGPSEQTEVQISVTYSDGFGREIQSKLLVESGLAWVRQPDDTYAEELVDERWMSSGRTVFNNKQQPVKQYEPFYTDTEQYQPEEFFAEYGVTPVIHYDPLGRVVRTDSPRLRRVEGDELIIYDVHSKVEFTPWEVETHDFNDTILDSEYYGIIGDLSPDEQAALTKAEAHAGTPRVAILDTLGREFLVKDRLDDDDPPTELVTQTTFDITGQPLTVTDPRGNVAFTYTYDMIGASLRTESIDAGDDRMLANVMGNPVINFDARAHRIEAEYDALHRLTKKTVDGGDLSDNVVEVLEYGEGVTDDQAKNLRGQLYRHFDQAGLVKLPLYDIKGQARQAERRLRTEYKLEADWPDTDPELLLETETFTSDTTYDALGRVKVQINPDTSEVKPEFHQSGRLKKILAQLKGDSTDTGFVSSISYNAKSQREKIEYGNGTETEYWYEPETFRLASLVTTRTSDSKVLQDIACVYDPVGNIVKITDDSHNRVLTGNGPVEPTMGFLYDALYRLLEATGRTHDSLAGNEYKDAGAFKQSVWTELNDLGQLSTYTRNYSYDDAGNLFTLQHVGTNSFTRNIDVDTDTNRALLRTGVDPVPPAEFDTSFDANGNQIEIEHLAGLAWNYRDNISRSLIIDRDDPDPDDAEYYVYDAAGQRVRKVTERLVNGGTVEIEEKIYLGGVEIKRIHQKNGSTTKILDRSSLHVMDGTSRVALVHHWTQDDLEREVPSSDLDTNKARYQYGNHLGSASLELDDTGQVISYEEYFPYGGTAFMAGSSQAEVKLKEYRYTGKERDDATSFYYYGARYYAPWLGRWMSCDPAGPVDGLNLYVYVSGNPLRLKDAKGTQEVSAEGQETIEEVEAEAAELQEYTEYTFEDKVVQGEIHERPTEEPRGTTEYFDVLESEWTTEQEEEYTPDPEVELIVAETDVIRLEQQQVEFARTAEARERYTKGAKDVSKKAMEKYNKAKSEPGFRGRYKAARDAVKGRRALKEATRGEIPSYASEQSATTSIKKSGDPLGPKTVEQAAYRDPSGSSKKINAPKEIKTTQEVIESSGKTSKSATKLTRGVGAISVVTMIISAIADAFEIERTGTLSPTGVPIVMDLSKVPDGTKIYDIDGNYLGEAHEGELVDQPLVVH